MESIESKLQKRPFLKPSSIEKVYEEISYYPTTMDPVREREKTSFSIKMGLVSEISKISEIREIPIEIIFDYINGLTTFNPNTNVGILSAEIETIYKSISESGLKSLLLGEVLSSGNDTKNEFKRILENRLNIVDSSINDFTSRIVNTDESRLTEVEKENVTRVHVSMLESQSLKKILSLF